MNYSELKDRLSKYRVLFEMMIFNGDFLFGSACIVAGTFLLTFIDKVVVFDQNSGLKLKAFARRKLRNSPLNRELWPVGTPSASRASKIAFRIAGILRLLLGIAFLLLAFREHAQ